MKARQVLLSVSGAIVLGAGALQAQGNMNNTQRPLRQGQTRGPAFMVPVFRSAERGLGVQVADAVRDRLMNDNLMTSIWVISKKDLNSNLEQSGYSVSDALSSTDLRQLAVFIRADEYLDGTVSRGEDGSLTANFTLNLPRGEGLEQPLPAVTGAKPGDIAARISGEIEKARKQVKESNDCFQSFRQRQYDEAKGHAARALREYDQAVFPRMCLLEMAISQRQPADTLIRIAEGVLAAHPANDRALKVVVDQYAAKSQTDKAYEAKYIAALEKLLAAGPNNTSLQAQIVTAFGAAGKFDRAKPVIDEAVKQNPGDPDLVRLQWGVYRAMNLWKGAVAIGEEMIRHDTAAADTVFFQQLVAAYLSDSQPVKAQEAASRGATKFPSNSTLGLSVIQLARQNGQFPQALEAADRLIAADPKNTSAHLQKAQIYLEQDNVDGMTAALHAAVAAGAPKDIAGGMVLQKANGLFQAYQKDTTKTVEGGDMVLGLLAFADSLNPTSTSGFLMAATQVVMAQPLLARASETKSCADARRTNDMLISAQELVRKHGRDFGQSAGGVMQGAIAYQEYADRAVKAFCKS